MSPLALKRSRSSSLRYLLSVPLLSLPLLAGCAVNSTIAASSPLPALAKGNWQFSSADNSAAHLPSLSGELSGTSASISGLLHSQSLSACVVPGTTLEVSGAADATGAIKLTGPVANGILTITGTLASDGKSISNATYTVTGGTCAFVKPAVATAQAYTPINGTYTGTFSDADGPVITISAQLQQSDLSNTSGNFTLNGSGTFGQNPCFTSPVQVSGTQVTGGSFTMTYADSTTGNQVTASGTFSPDATTLTVTSWQLSGSCGPDTGVASTMTKQ